jgi:hypothetical protein
MTKSFTRRVSRMSDTQLRELLYRAHAKDLWRVVDIITTETDERHPDPRDEPHDHADEQVLYDRHNILSPWAY